MIDARRSATGLMATTRGALPLAGPSHNPHEEMMMHRGNARILKICAASTFGLAAVAAGVAAAAAPGGTRMDYGVLAAAAPGGTRMDYGALAAAAPGGTRMDYGALAAAAPGALTDGIPMWFGPNGLHIWYGPNTLPMDE
jgi:hypothetical protein